VGSLLALFSPRVSVKRSVNFTKHYISTGEYRHDVVRSVRAAVDHWSKTGEIRGPKTSAFRNAMLGDLNAVVLDVWMAKFFKVDQKVFGTKSGYRLFSERLCRIADALGVSPRDAQATVWVYTLRLHGRNPPMMDLSDLIEQELFT
jgi:cobalamin biosynthesis protein CbiD